MKNKKLIITLAVLASLLAVAALLVFVILPNHFSASKEEILEVSQAADSLMNVGTDEIPAIPDVPDMPETPDSATVPQK